jgi:PhzF family phenazine biosynthesis protein
MKLKIYQVDAFTNKLFGGNPAAVCPLESWLSDEILHNIAMENNLAETAFYVNENGSFRIRWFTPKVEVVLCGHATLATAHVLFNHEGFTGDEITFNSLSGPLRVNKNGDLLTLDFPADIVKPSSMTTELRTAFQAMPMEVWKGKTDYMLVYGSEDEITNLHPDFGILAKAPVRGIIVTSKGKNSDFVSRFFAPASGVDEDHVTGSAHTLLTPYWSAKLNKKSMTAIQLSPRKGHLQCTYAGDRVMIGGNAKTYLIGTIKV